MIIIFKALHYYYIYSNHLRYKLSSNLKDCLYNISSSDINFKGKIAIKLKKELKLLLIEKIKRIIIENKRMLTIK